MGGGRRLGTIEGGASVCSRTRFRWKKKAPSPRMAEMGLCDVIFDFKCEIPAYGGNPLARSVLSSRSAISLCAWGRLEICWGHPEHESDIPVRMGKTGDMLGSSRTCERYPCAHGEDPSRDAFRFPVALGFPLHRPSPRIAGSCAVSTGV